MRISIQLSFDYLWVDWQVESGYDGKLEGVKLKDGIAQIMSLGREKERKRWMGIGDERDVHLVSLDKIIAIPSSSKRKEDFFLGENRSKCDIPVFWDGKKKKSGRSIGEK